MLELPLETLLAIILTIVVARSSVLQPGGRWDTGETVVFNGGAALSATLSTEAAAEAIACHEFDCSGGMAGRAAIRRELKR